MFRTPRRPRFALLALAALLAAAGRGEADDEAIQDPDYRFRLERPGPEWRLLPEAEVQRTLPDAVAGARTEDGLSLVVIVGEAGNATLASLARFVADTVPVAERNVEGFETLTFRGLPAYRWRVTGRLNGVEVRGRYVVFLRDGFLFQTIAWGLRSRVPADLVSIDALFAAFTLLPGTLRARETTRAAPDAVGVGWRVKDGVFESAAYRLAVKPVPGWRLAVGTELRRMNPNAEVGLVGANPEAYVALIVEAAPNEDRADFARRIGESVEKNLGVAPEDEPIATAVEGRSIVLRRYVTQGSPSLEMLHGVLFEGDFCVQVQAWSLATLAERMRPKALGALASIRFLSRHEASAVASELAQGPDPQNAVGATWSLRRGTYRDFAHGLTWTSPGGWWRLRPGEEAHLANASATLTFEEPSLGVTGVVIAESPQGLDAARYHDAVAANNFDDPARAGQPEPTSVGSVEGLGRSGRRTLDGLTYRARLVTALHGDKAYLFRFTGTVANMKASQRAVEEALRGFAFPAEPLTAVATDEDGTYRDERLGFAMGSLGPDWTRSDATPSGMESIASMTSWERPDVVVIVGAFCMLEEGQDEEWAFGQITRGMAGRNVPGMDAKPAAVEESTLADLPAKRLSWSAASPMEAYVVRRDRTMYVLWIGRQRADVVPSVDEVKARFRLLD